MWDNPCWAREELALANGRATLLSGFTSAVARVPADQPGPCPARPYDTFLAHVYLDQTVVMVSAPGVSGPGGTAKSPYDTRDGIETLVRALRPRQVGKDTP